MSSARPPRFLPSSFRSCHEYLTTSADFLTHPISRLLLHSSNVDFFVLDLWSFLPHEWHAPLQSLSVREAIELPSGLLKEEWPESLKAYLYSARSFYLQKQPHELFRPHPDSIQELKKGFQEKKKHEVAVLAPAITKAANALGIKHLVDVGSGQGYLSNILAYRYGFHVTGIDSSDHNTQAATSKGEDLKKDMEKMGVLANGSYVGVTARVSSQTNLDVLESMVKESDEMSTEHKDGGPSHHVPRMIVGLHCCGDLTSSMLRLFAAGQGDALFQFSCCYHLITEAVDYEHIPCYKKQGGDGLDDCKGCQQRHPTPALADLGFPLSTPLRAVSCELGRRARIMACQSTDRWPLEYEESLQIMRNSLYRTVLEKILRDHYPGVHSLPAVLTGFVPLDSARSEYPLVIKNIPAPVMRKSFGEYANYVLTQRLRAPIQHSVDELQQMYDNLDIGRHRATVFWALKCVLSTVVESLILVDRVTYLREQLGLDSDSANVSGRFGDVAVVPVFDPTISPRNMAIVAVRNGSIEDLLATMQESTA
eukprot:TRINITY_DN4180_c0_g1_i3.p1 TRINITY_DN4180_c0_g1~~TRINITY_DN4180_c0_g1_i3.p1  ORF type:complete len:537 (+),score=106.21 TRINITY_DN4180_c0_g1_i3:109-1719(+)